MRISEKKILFLGFHVEMYLFVCITVFLAELSFHVKLMSSHMHGGNHSLAETHGVTIQVTVVNLECTENHGSPFS